MLIAIVDDIAEERILLRTRLENILNQKNVEFHCYEYENGEAFLKASKEHDFTVLFLDIYMNGANGIEIAREFRNTNKDCLLIFTTTSLDHALEGFKVRAMHYLVKPYMEEELSSLIDEILSRIPASEKKLTVKVNGSDLQIPFKTIIHADHFFSYDPYSYNKGKRACHPTVFWDFYCSFKRRFPLFYLQQRNDHQHGTCC